MMPDPSTPSRPPGAVTTASGGVIVEGAAVHLGEPGTFRLAVDAEGRHDHRVTGPLAEGHGWDGAAGWAVDWSGAAHTIALRELDLARLLALGITGRWRLAAPGAVERGRVVLALPGGPVVGVAAIDSAGRATSMELAGPAGPIHYAFADHRGDVAGTITVTQDDVVLDRLTVRRVSPLDAPIVAATATPRDATWTPAGPCRLPLRRAPTGHLLVEAALDGVRGWFVVDTGAQLHVVMPAWARRLGLAPRGVAPLSSVLGTEPATVSRARALTVGALTIDAPHLVEHDLSPLAGGLGVDLAGVLGFGLFRRAVVEVEHDALTLHPLDAAPAAAWHPLVIDHGHPIVAAELPGLGRRWLRLDLGAAGDPFGHLVITRPHGAALGAGAARRQLRIGTYRFAAGAVPWIDVAGHRFDDVPAAFALDDAGIFADAYLAGQIGASLLAGHRILIDLSRARCALASL